MARELLPPELRAAARWASSVLLARLGRTKRERRTLVVRIQQADAGGGLADVPPCPVASFYGGGDCLVGHHSPSVTFPVMEDAAGLLACFTVNAWHQELPDKCSTNLLKT